MDGAPGAGLEIIARGGDGLLDGVIDASGELPGPLAAPRTPSRDPERIALPSPRGATLESCGDGGSIVVVQEQGDLTIGSNMTTIAGDGRDCEELLASDLSDLEFLDGGTTAIYFPRSGGRGGDVTLEAPAGAIRFLSRALENPLRSRPGAAATDRIWRWRRISPRCPLLARTLVSRGVRAATSDPSA